MCKRPTARLLPLVASFLLAAQSASPESVAQLISFECVGCRANLDQSRENYSPKQWEAMVDGEVITSEVRDPSVEDSERSTVSASGIIPSPAERVWSVILDFEAYPDFLPNVKQTRVRQVEGNRVWIAQHLKVLFVNIRYGSVWTLDPEHGLATWSLDRDTPHDIAANEGSWRLVPVMDGAHTLVRYHVKVDTGRPVPGPIENMLTNRSLPRVVRGLRAEVQRRHPPSEP